MLGHQSVGVAEGPDPVAARLQRIPDGDRDLAAASPAECARSLRPEVGGSIWPGVV